MKKNGKHLGQIFRGTEKSEENSRSLSDSGFLLPQPAVKQSRKIRGDVIIYLIHFSCAIVGTFAVLTAFGAFKMPEYTPAHVGLSILAYLIIQSSTLTAHFIVIKYINPNINPVIILFLTAVLILQTVNDQLAQSTRKKLQAISLTYQTLPGRTLKEYLDYEHQFRLKLSETENTGYRNGLFATDEGYEILDKQEILALPDTSEITITVLPQGYLDTLATRGALRSISDESRIIGTYSRNNFLSQNEKNHINVLKLGQSGSSHPGLKNSSQFAESYTFNRSAINKSKKIQNSKTVGEPYTTEYFNDEVKDIFGNDEILSSSEVIQGQQLTIPDDSFSVLPHFLAFKYQDDRLLADLSLDKEGILNIASSKDCINGEICLKSLLVARSDSSTYVEKQRKSTIRIIGGSLNDANCLKEPEYLSDDFYSTSTDAVQYEDSLSIRGGYCGLNTEFIEVDTEIDNVVKNYLFEIMLYSQNKVIRNSESKRIGTNTDTLISLSLLTKQQGPPSPYWLVRWSRRGVGWYKNFTFDVGLDGGINFGFINGLKRYVCNIHTTMAMKQSAERLSYQSRDSRRIVNTSCNPVFKTGFALNTIDDYGLCKMGLAKLSHLTEVELSTDRSDVNAQKAEYFFDEQEMLRLGKIRAAKKVTTDPLGSIKLLMQSDLQDYVFDVGYNLEGVEEIEALIVDNLLGFSLSPSEVLIQDRSVYLNEMNAVVLAKTEELSLHFFEQYLKIDNLLKEIVNLDRDSISDIGNIQLGHGKLGKEELFNRLDSTNISVDRMVGKESELTNGTAHENASWFSNIILGEKPSGTVFHLIDQESSFPFLPLFPHGNTKPNPSEKYPYFKVKGIQIKIVGANGDIIGDIGTAQEGDELKIKRYGKTLNYFKNNRLYYQHKIDKGTYLRPVINIKNNKAIQRISGSDKGKAVISLKKE